MYGLRARLWLTDRLKSGLKDGLKDRLPDRPLGEGQTRLGGGALPGLERKPVAVASIRGVVALGDQGKPRLAGVLGAGHSRFTLDLGVYPGQVEAVGDGERRGVNARASHGENFR